MLFNSANAFAVLALMLIAGWFFGMASRPGTRRWKDQITELEVEQARLKDQLSIKDKRIAELTRERDATLKNSASPAPSPAPVPVTDGASGGWRGWFGWGRDNLTRIKGIDDARERQLNERGYKTFREIEGMSADEQSRIEAALGLEAGSIAREGWRDQARLLRDGQEAEHARQYA